MPRTTGTLLTMAKLAWAVFLLAIFVVNKMNALDTNTAPGAAAPLAVSAVAPAAASSANALGKRAAPL